MERRVAKVVVAIVRPPLLVLGFVFGGIYKLLFSRLDRRLALKNQLQLEQDIRECVSSSLRATELESCRNRSDPFAEF